MDHLTEEKHSLIRIFFNSLIADLYGVLNSVAKAKMSRDVKNNWPEVECSGREILFTKIFDSSRFLDLTRDGRPVIGGYIELFYNKEILTNCKVRRKLA